jgi:acyl dehydratase
MFKRLFGRTFARCFCQRAAPGARNRVLSRAIIVDTAKSCNSTTLYSFRRSLTDEDYTMAVKIVPKEQMLDAIGTKFEPGEWIEVTQERINTFADCTEDHQFIHVDEEAAKNTPFGGTIAHGFLTLSLLSKLVEGNGVIPENIVMGLNYGFDKVRFLAPVRSGKRVRANASIADITRKDDNRFLVKQAISVEIEGEETPALIAEWLTMVIAG